MKRILLYIYLSLIVVSTAASAQVKSADDGLYKQANEMYKKGNYSDAAKLYEEALKTGVSPELYYNLGNAYYKTGEIGLSILNYERAIRLKPNYKEARTNLLFVQQKVVDNLTATPGFFVKRWMMSVLECFTSNQWAVISILTFALSLGLILLFAFSRERKIRKLTFYGAFFILFFSIASFIMSGLRKDQMLKHRDAIVMNGAITAKSSPDKSGTDLFQLHEGTKVQVKSTLSNWAEIELENGAVGWVEENAIERI